MDKDRAVELLKSSEYGVLSMIDENGLPYGVPLNYVWMATLLYIFIAPLKDINSMVLRNIPT